MSFIREMGNVAVTLGAFQGTGMLTDKVITNKNWFSKSVKFGVSTGALYYGNKFMAEKGPNEVKDLIRDRAVTKLQAMGIQEPEALAAFEQHYDEGPVSKPGFFRNVGNIMSTRIMAGIGAMATTFLASKLTNLKFDGKKDRSISNLLTDFDFNADSIAKKAVVMFGALTGGYFGNKLMQGPSSGAYEERANDIVARILAERKPIGEMSQVEALQRRSQGMGELTR